MKRFIIIDNVGNVHAITKAVNYHQALDDYLNFRGEGARDALIAVDDNDFESFLSKLNVLTK